MYPQIAKSIQELLQGASISASRQNTVQLNNIHAFLDGIQSGALVVTAKPAAEKAKK